VRIDCERCPYRRGSLRCADCLVEFVLRLEGDGVVVEADEEADGTVELDAEEARAIQALSEAGLIEEVTIEPLEDAG
jgi:hypothetical protein